MTKNRATQAIAIGTLFAAVSAFMPSAITTSGKIWDKYINEISKTELSIDNWVSLFFYLFTIVLTFVFGYRWECSSQLELDEKHKQLDIKLSEQTTNSHFIMNYLHNASTAIFGSI